MMNNEYKNAQQAQNEEQSRLASLLTPENIEMALKVGAIGVKVLPKLAAVAGNPVVISVAAAGMAGVAKAASVRTSKRMAARMMGMAASQAAGMIFGKR